MQTQRGQTLIETLVAAFILVMGITAALGLATYSLGATTSIRQQTIGLGLAREGIEVTKNIRDTNWLKATIAPNCYNFLTGDNDSYCYQDWLNPRNGEGQNMDPEGATTTYRIFYDTNSAQPWQLIQTKSDFALNIRDLGPASASFDGVYFNSVENLDPIKGTSGFARKITIIPETFAPFNTNNGPRLRVISQVWWTGKGCAMTSDVPDNKRCLVTLETYLTNWKNF